MLEKYNETFVLNFMKCSQYNSKVHTEADCDVVFIDWMLKNCMKLTKMYHRKIFEGNS
jgi:hypothetical protein